MIYYFIFTSARLVLKVAASYSKYRYKRKSGTLGRNSRT
jgi:hypothetical protein